MKLKMSNFGRTTLAGALTDTATTVLLSPGTGALFPAIVAGEFFPLSLVKLVAGEPVREIVHVTARTNDACTVLRARENTTAQTFASGDSVLLVLSAEGINGKVNREGDSFTGPVAFNDQDVSGAALKDCGDRSAIVGAPSGTTHTIDYRNGSFQKWSPPPGPCTLVITNWPPAGINGQLWIKGLNLGLCTITTQVSLAYLKTDGSTNLTTSMNANQGVTLRSAGYDNVLIWGDTGVPSDAKIAR